MSFLLFIAVVVLVIVLISKNSSDKTTRGDQYAQGYWDGYRALGDKIQQIINRHPVDTDALQREINAGQGGRAETIDEDPLITKMTAMPVEVTPQTYVEPALGHPEKPGGQQSLTNLNILLFVASLLFVAAGAAFVATAMPDGIKLFGVWLLVTAFYAAGMMLQPTKLKPAGTAFIGTSLGLIPFAGIALYQLAAIPGPVAWCLTSLVGVVAYFFAALRLKSQVVSYLTLAFVVSLASSFAESLSAPLMWNFVLIIGVSLVINLLAYLKPKWLPTIFSEPVERTGQIVTPLTLVASLTLIDQLSLFAYEVVFGMATLHYVVIWMKQRHGAYETLVRALAHITVFLIAVDMLDTDRVAIGIMFVGLALLQQVYSLVRLKMNPVTRIYEWAWVSVMQFFQFWAPALWVATRWDAELTTVTYAVIALSSVALALISRKMAAATPALLMSLILPFIKVFWLFQFALGWVIVAGWFTLAAAVVLAIWPYLKNRSGGVKSFFMAAFLCYSGFAAWTALACGVDWSLLVFSLLTMLLWYGSFRMKQAFISVLGSIAFVAATVQGWRVLELDSAWLPLGVAWVASAVLYLAYWLFVQYRDSQRAMGVLGMVWILLGFGALVTFFDSEMDVAASLTIVAGAATLAVEGYRQKNRQLMEVAAYIATFGLQRCVGLVYPELNIVFYAHWWALSIAAIAVWRREFTTRLIVAMAFVTASTGIYALAEGGLYQLLFLSEHVALLIAGFLLKKQWALWWGVIASILAVLYFLRDVAFLAFAFLGLVVIGIVIWRLAQHDKPVKN